MVSMPRRFAKWDGYDAYEKGEVIALILERHQGGPE
jgi:hypothetical protein